MSEVRSLSAQDLEGIPLIDDSRLGALNRPGGRGSNARFQEEMGDICVLVDAITPTIPSTLIMSSLSTSSVRNVLIILMPCLLD